MSVVIKTENLADTINVSKGDYVVVLGDRNMKNRTVQAKRKGKLVETAVCCCWGYCDRNGGLWSSD